jgi:hypothetical protein
MLEELLRLIREGGSFDTAMLAKQLNTTQAMVVAMMDHLRRSGLLKIYDPGNCSCEQCSLAQMCDPEKRQREVGHLWLYEEKKISEKVQ